MMGDSGKGNREMLCLTGEKWFNICMHGQQLPGYQLTVSINGGDLFFHYNVK